MAIVFSFIYALLCTRPFVKGDQLMSRGWNLTERSIRGENSVESQQLRNIFTHEIRLNYPTNNIDSNRQDELLSDSEKKQQDPTPEEIVQLFKNKIETKFDNTGMELNGVDHKINMLDSKLDIELKRISNVVEEADNKLHTIVNELDQKHSTIVATRQSRQKSIRKCVRYILIFSSFLETLICSV